MIVLAVALLALLGVAFAVLAGATRSRLRTLDADLADSWVELVALLTLRDELVPRLVSVVRQHAPDRSRVLDVLTADHVAATRSRGFVGTWSVAGAARAERRLTRSLDAVLELAATRPALDDDVELADVRRDLEQLDQRIDSARAAYNQQVADYNEAAGTFPGTTIATESRDAFELR